MSIAGFDCFRDAARFTSPAGPVTREELTASVVDGNPKAGFSEVVMRQKEATN